MSILLNCVLALVALINPISKIFVLSSLARQSEAVELRRISAKATLVAGAILIVFVLVGNVILQNIFRVGGIDGGYRIPIPIWHFGDIGCYCYRSGDQSFGDAFLSKD